MYSPTDKVLAYNLNKDTIPFALRLTQEEINASDENPFLKVLGVNKKSITDLINAQNPASKCAKGVDGIILDNNQLSTLGLELKNLGFNKFAYYVLTLIPEFHSVWNGAQSASYDGDELTEDETIERNKVFYQAQLAAAEIVLEANKESQTGDRFGIDKVFLEHCKKANYDYKQSNLGFEYVANILSDALEQSRSQDDIESVLNHVSFLKCESVSFHVGSTLQKLGHHKEAYRLFVNFAPSSEFYNEAQLAAGQIITVSQQTRDLETLLMLSEYIRVQHFTNAGVTAPPSALPTSSNYAAVTSPTLFRASANQDEKVRITSESEHTLQF